MLCFSVFKICFGQPEVDSISEKDLQSEATFIAERHKNYNNHQNNDNDFAYFEIEVGHDASSVAMTSIKMYQKKEVEKYQNMKSDVCGRRVHVESKVEVIPVPTDETANHIKGYS